MKLFGKHGMPPLSELDQFMNQFNEQRNKPCPSREAEHQKHADIADRRDKKMTPDDTKIWEGF